MVGARGSSCGTSRSLGARRLAQRILGRPTEVQERTMAREFKSSRDVIIRTGAWKAATDFYRSKLGFRLAYKDEQLVGFETGSFRLYVEAGRSHGPVFDFLVPDVK